MKTLQATLLLILVLLIGFIIDPRKSNWSNEELNLTINHDNTVSYYRNDHAELKFKNAG